jgi:hypothetical protein
MLKKNGSSFKVLSIENASYIIKNIESDTIQKISYVVMEKLLKDDKIEEVI